MKGIFGSHINLTAKVMDMRLERQNTVMANIVNVNTPEYKTRRIEFEDRLQKALDQDARGRMTRTNKEHLPVAFNPEGFQGRGVEALRARSVYGEDTVDLDKEMAVMTKNGLMYNALASVLKKNFEGMQKAIQEGSK